jgi:hypothetical protein
MPTATQPAATCNYCGELMVVEYQRGIETRRWCPNDWCPGNVQGVEVVVAPCSHCGGSGVEPEDGA